MYLDDLTIGMEFDIPEVTIDKEQMLDFARLKPVFAEDVLTGKARISNIIKRNPYNGIAEVTTDVHNQNGEIVLTDVTETVVKYKTVI